MTAPTTTLIDGHPVDGARLAELCRRYGVAELAVFGSVARGDASEASDVNLRYVLVPGAHLRFAINELGNELARLFDPSVDLVAKLDPAEQAAIRTLIGGTVLRHQARRLAAI